MHSKSSRIMRLTAAGMLFAAAILSSGNSGYVGSAQEKDGLAGTINGRVFRDFNGNGAYETSGGTTAQPTAVDTGLAAVTVSAYDSTGTLRGTATTAADGTYSLSATGTGPYRIEFTNLPNGYLPSARSTDSVLGGSSTNSGSTVQFVNDGATSNVNLAVNRAADYCQNNPTICSQLYGVGSATQPEAVFTVPYWAGSTRTTGGNPVTDFASPATVSLADTDQVGTTFGMAYNRRARLAYVASYMKKHAKFGPGGTGAIYQVNPATASVTEYVNINNIFGATTAGTNPHNPLDYNTDNGQATWNAVGKIAFGGMAISEDDANLFVMSLADRRLYRIPTSGPLNSTTIARSAFPTTMPNCANSGDVRPFSVNWYEGTLYVGAVCSQESNAGAFSTDLRAYVYTVNPTTLAFSASPVVNIRLDYTRLETDPGLSALWRNWRTNYTTISTSHFIYPQPMVTDIEFDRGNMIMLIRDRNGDQSGYNSASNPNNSSQLFKGITAGDIIRLCGAPNTWTLESNGRCGGIGSAPQNTNEGPGGGEYYYQDNYHPNGNPHDEVGLGAAMQIPGHNEMVATIFDPTYIPLDNIYDAGGFRWFNNSTGAQNRGYLAYAAGDFGKANGIGNVQAFCEAAPIEIGNRLWRDANGNGVQDPGEAVLSGVTVNLYRGSTLVGTAVTSSNGEYYFVSSTTADPNPLDNIGLVNGGILYNTAYQIRLDNPLNYLLLAPLYGLSPTVANVNTQAGDKDASDSDAVIVQNPAGSPLGFWPVAAFTTGGPGANDHAIDIGMNNFVPTSSNVALEGRVITADGAGIRNVSVKLENPKGDTLYALTGSFGYFRFEGIPAGSTVIVSVGAKRFTFQTPSRVFTVDKDLTEIEFVADAK